MLIVPVNESGGRPCCKHRWRDYADALLYLVTTGSPCRSLPHDFSVTWSATHKHFAKWTKKRLWEQILAILRAQDRAHDGRDEAPTAAVVDSSSVKSTQVPGPRGFDGATKIDGIKRHIVVDTAGRLIAVHATAASVQDRATLTDRRGKNPCPTVEHVWADKGYTGQAPAEAAATAGIEPEIVSGPEPVATFVVQPRRWVVERTNGWISGTADSRDSTKPP